MKYIARGKSRVANIARGEAQNQVINETLVWFLDLLGLLYHSTVGRKAY